MWHSPSPSSTSLLLASTLAVGCAGCGDDECGPMGAQPAALVASSAAVTLTYGSLTSLVGNDCPAVEPPPGVISVSVEGKQVDGPGLITFCIARPDLFNGTRATLGTALSMADVRIFDVTGTVDNCMYTLDSTRPPTGFAAGLGVCENGDSSAGFGVDFDGAISLRRTCGSTIDTVAVTLTGIVAVTRRPD